MMSCSEPKARRVSDMDDSGIDCGPGSPNTTILEIYCFEDTGNWGSMKRQGTKRAHEQTYSENKENKIRGEDNSSPSAKKRRLVEVDEQITLPVLMKSQPVILHCAENDDGFRLRRVSMKDHPWTRSDKEKALKVLEVDHDGFIEYEMDIYLHRRSIEANYHPVECLANQPQLTTGMRALLVEWLTRVHSHVKLAPYSLFLAVNVIDRFLITTPISRDCFQLLGITSLLIASKQEEVFPPEIEELLQLCSDTYTRAQVKQLERIILCKLQFDLLAPTPVFFLEHYAAARLRTAHQLKCSVSQIRRTRAVARYILELTLQDYNLCQYCPSLLALGGLEVADEINHCGTRTGALYCGGYSKDGLYECIDELRLLGKTLIQNNPDMEVIYEKYMNVEALAGKSA